jgi:hypothetical protein
MKQMRDFWAVVRVWRGIPSGVELFSREGPARDRERQLRQQLPPEDEVGVFKVAIPQEVIT